MIAKLGKTIKAFLLIFVIIISTSQNVFFESKVNNSNLNKTVDLQTMAKKINEIEYDTKYGAKDTYTGSLTGYVYNCPLCTGQLACMWRYDITDGKNTYIDSDYGEVNIVASSTNLPCGTIIRFNSKRISDEPVYAIVLDRGVLGSAIDFLSPSYEYAVVNVGRSTITYDVLRSGWKL